MGKFDFTLNLIVASGDIDELGHTNNVAYIRYCERAAWAHSQQLGLAAGDYHRLDRAMAVNRAEYDYLLPSFAADEITVTTWLHNSDQRTRMTRKFCISRGKDTLFRGLWTVVCIRLSSGKIARLPPEFLAIYGAAIDTGPATTIDSD